MSTAESTNNTENGDHPASRPAYDDPASRRRSTRMGASEAAIRTNADLESIGESSFPYLNNPGSGFSVASGKEGEDAVELGCGVEVSSSDDRRGVRFSRNLDALTHIFTIDENGEAPWDERADEISPTSVMDLGATSNQQKAQTKTAAPSPRPVKESSPSSSPPSDQLKSILRPARFSPPSDVATNYARGMYNGMSYNSHLLAMYDEYILSGMGVNTSVSMSPPRNGSGFVDHGVELSPIENEKINTGARAIGHPAEKRISSVSIRDIVEQANCLYPGASTLVEDISVYSDPTAEVLSESNVRFYYCIVPHFASRRDSLRTHILLLLLSAF